MHIGGVELTEWNWDRGLIDPIWFVENLNTLSGYVETVTVPSIKPRDGE